MDARLIMENVRWAFTETLRIFWKGTDREQVAKAIRELLQFDVPCIGKFEDVIMVQRTDLSAEEEVLVLLHYAGEQGFTRTELGKYAMVSPASVTTALKKLVSPEVRQVKQLPNDRYRLTDLGSKRIREQMPDKLFIT
jgi:DNA-binding MarR family transcriptional regulator